MEVKVNTGFRALKMDNILRVEVVSTVEFMGQELTIPSHFDFDADNYLPDDIAKFAPEFAQVQHAGLSEMAQFIADNVDLYIAMMMGSQHVQ